MTLVIKKPTTSKLVMAKTSASRPLVDAYPAAAAFSLRSLTAGNPAVVRVRRSSDNTEQDFTAAQVADGTLTTFCGTGNGFVRTWYDQAASTNHAIQASASIQPQIVSNGSLITQSGKPAISFLGGLCRLTCDGLWNRTFMDLYVVKNTSDTQYTLFTGGANQFSWVAESGSSSTFIRGAWGSGSLYANGTLFTGTTRDQIYNFLNGYKLEVHQAANSWYANGWLSYFDIGCLARTTSFDFVGNIQEIIAFQSDQSANRTAIESRINTHYAIY